MNLVSIILPSHNSAAYIEHSVKSVLSQTYIDLELITVDDGSTDQTPEMLHKLARHDDRMTVISLAECSGGPAKPRNVGLAAAKGNYFAFIDSDDAWHPRKLERQLSLMKKDDLGFLSTQHIAFQSDLPSPTELDETSVQTTAITHQTLIRKNRVVTSSALMSRTFATGLQFDERPAYVGVEDYLAWLILHQNATQKSAVLHSPLVFYRLRHDSISSSKKVMAQKIFYLLSNYQIDGKGLGLGRYFYFVTYIFHSLLSRLQR